GSGLPRQNEPSAYRGLPDILAPGLSVIFCGINPAITAGLTGRHFASPTNRFWRVLHRSGFTAQQIVPEEARSILKHPVLRLRTDGRRCSADVRSERFVEPRTEASRRFFGTQDQAIRATHSRVSRQASLRGDHREQRGDLGTAAGALWRIISLGAA